MGRYPGEERRRSERYETDVRIEFRVNFDVKTKINFRIKEKPQTEFSHKKYSAFSRNVSVEGLAFLSNKKLHKGDILSLEVYVPSASAPIPMEGEVRWCCLTDPPKGDEDEEIYDTGVKVIAVNGENVEKTVFVDKIHSIVWSIVLESIFGSFKHLTLKRRKIKGA